MAKGHERNTSYKQTISLTGLKSYICLIAGIDEIDSKYLRPQLTKKRLTKKQSNIDKKVKTLLICNQSSCMMRNIEFDEIYQAIPENVKNNYYIYAYEDTISGTDIMNKFTGKYQDVHFILAPTLSDFLNARCDRS